MFFDRGCCKNNSFGMPNMNPKMGFVTNNVGNEIIEPVTTKCIEKEFYHEVAHV